MVIGYDRRRFLARELAEAIAAAVRGCGLQPLLAGAPRAHPRLQLERVVERRSARRPGDHRQP